MTNDDIDRDLPQLIERIPCTDVMERLEGLSVYRTDEQGVVEIITDGVQLWVETER